MLTDFKKHSIFWMLFTVLFIGAVSVIVLDERVERSELIDDSVIVELAEGKYRFKIPVDYIYDKLVTDEFLKEHRGIDRKFKKIYKDSRFDITAIYPDMAPVNLAKDKPGFGNKIRISLGVEHNPVPLRKSAAERIPTFYPEGEINPEGFGSNEIVKYEGDSLSTSDHYFYKKDVILMVCRKENTSTTPPFPSCRSYSDYKDLELTYSFSVDYKTQFIKIDMLIHEFLESLESPQKER